VEPNEPLMLEIETKKNDLYKSLITDQLGPSNVYSNTLDVLFQAKQKDLKICVLSHSKNAEIIIQRLGLLNAFDYVCIPEDQSNDDSITRPVGSSYITKSIDSFLKKTGFLGKECIGIENTKLGLDEFNSFGIFSVCIDNFDKEIAKDSKISFHTVADVNLDEIIFKYYTIMGDE
ncbi:MAG: hypothetical protein K2M43_00315, partial [Mycoplasmoidaceae bacterium]|nr:hypothetical protein [Mycoplasmoidaceae bacterium]